MTSSFKFDGASATSYQTIMTTPAVYTFDFSGSVYKYIKLQLYGAGGGHSKGGIGGYMSGIIDLSIIPSKKFYIVVGGAGGTAVTSTSSTLAYSTGGTNGGGRGVEASPGTSIQVGGGGGATDMRLVYTGASVIDYAAAKRILVAGGGGGGTGNPDSDSNGGNAGYPNAPNVPNVSYGGADGGTQIAGGSLNGGLGVGGENATNTGWNGGGGGGYYGGGACKGQHGGGAGGSGYYDNTYVTSADWTSGGGGSAAMANGRAILTLIIDYESYESIFTSHTFTNAGATGRIGPTLSAVRSAYSTAAWAQDTTNGWLNMIGDNGIQLWTVPKTGKYTIDAYGGGTSTGGAGGRIKGDFALTKNSVLSIVCGQVSIYGTWSVGGGLPKVAAAEHMFVLEIEQRQICCV